VGAALRPGLAGMKTRINTGRGVTGCIRYVTGQGRDPKTGRFKALEPGAESRARLLGGSGFGFEIENEADAELARRMMEYAALNQGSKTRKCEQDCVHIVLAWERGEKPTDAEKMEAAQGALAKLGMKNAMYLVYSHNDEDYDHVHITASKINPATRRAYDLERSQRKLSEWAEQYEREHGGVVNINRESANELRRAIKERDVDGVLEAMTKRNATFTAKQLERAIGKEIYPKIGASAGAKKSVELERAQFVNAILSYQSVRRLADALDGAAARYTTRTVLEAEAHVLRAGNTLKTDTGHGIGEDRRAAVLAAKYATMSREQALAFRHCTGEEGLALIAGQAGAGKSYVMAAVRDAYEADRHRVVGLAPTNKVAKSLAGDGFGHAKTVHSELFALNNGRAKWDAKTVVMVDEAAMLDTKLMAMLTAHAADAGAKLILVGDDRQISSIDRGGCYAVLKDRHGAAVLKEVRRQYKADEKRASEMMHEGNFDAALAIYEKKGAIHWTRTQVEARAELVEKWAADTAADRDKSRFVFAYTNQDVDLLNVALRAVRKERGELEWRDHAITTAHGRFDFSAGDRIMFTGTDKRIGVDNGVAGTVLAIDGSHLAVRLDGREAKEINFDAVNFDKFRHAYAGTVHKGQGDTLDQTYLYHSEHFRSAPSYVALTRHRQETSLFVATNTAGDLTALAKQVARQEETRAASAFYQLDGIEPVRPMSAAEILAQFAGEHFQHTAQRMEREGRAAAWPEYRQDNRPAAPWNRSWSADPPGATAPQQRRADTPHSRWGDGETPGTTQRHRQRWRGLGGIVVDYGGRDHPHRPGNIRRRGRRGHGR
jgi:ATP-dependent exoDNAse (exonuclease V) alpha subunit